MNSIIQAVDATTEIIFSAGRGATVKTIIISNADPDDVTITVNLKLKQGDKEIHIMPRNQDIAAEGIYKVDGDIYMNQYQVLELTTTGLAHIYIMTE